MYNFIDKDDIYHLVVSRTPMAFSRTLANNFKENNIPISREQFSILVVLWNKEGCHQQFLAEQTYRDKPGITRLLDNLEKSGMVRRVSDPKDRRSKLVYLTQKGRDLEESVTRVANNTIEKAVKDISQEDMVKLKELLNKIYNNLN